jgi:DNA repair protein RadC
MASIQELPSQERPREKLAALGTGALSDSELLAILLRTGVRGHSAIELARHLLARFGSLGGLCRCTLQELCGVRGMGPAKALQLAAAFGLGSRLTRENLSRQRLDTPEQIWELLGADMRALHKESLRVVLLDTKFQLLRVEEISLGSLNESIAHPREIFRPALLHAAYALILVHNHPSGDPSPSNADHALTRRLSEGAQILQLRLLDHVILGSGDNGRQPWFSFRQAGLMA